MRKMINKILQKKIIRQFIKFCLIGAFNTFLDFSIYIFLTRVFLIYYLIANLINSTITVTFSFFLNKKWTFRDKNSQVSSQYIKFWIMALFGMGVNELILFLLVKYLGFYDLLAKVVAIGVVLFWNFFIGRYWVFKQNTDLPVRVEEVSNI